MDFYQKCSGINFGFPWKVSNKSTDSTNQQHENIAMPWIFKFVSYVAALPAGLINVD